MLSTANQQRILYVLSETEDLAHRLSSVLTTWTVKPITSARYARPASGAVVILDHREAALRPLREKGLPTIAVVERLSSEESDALAKGGAFKLLQSPLNLEQLRSVLDEAHAVAMQTAAAAHHQVVGASPAVQTRHRQARRVARLRTTSVLLRGETGTGKSHFAAILHGASGLRGPFLEVNCAALPEHLLESELFGHEKGAFTGAEKAKIGLVEAAGGGTLFLDEIDALTLPLQAKLLTFLERRVGAVDEVHVDTRVVCATNVPLEEKVADGSFRSDLYFRINVVTLTLPALRSVSEDIAPLARHFVDQMATRLGTKPKPLSPAAEAKLTTYSWPGNIRELRNVIERALVFSEKRAIRAEDIELSPDVIPRRTHANGVELISCAEVERRHIVSVLEVMQDAPLCDVAGVLGISKKTLWDRRRRYARYDNARLGSRTDVLA